MNLIFPPWMWNDLDVVGIVTGDDFLLEDGQNLLIEDGQLLELED